MAAEQKTATSSVIKPDTTSRKSIPGSFITAGLTVNADCAPVDSWVADSGTTHHITANKQHFATFEKFPIA